MARLVDRAPAGDGAASELELGGRGQVRVVDQVLGVRRNRTDPVVHDIAAGGRAGTAGSANGVGVGVLAGPQAWSGPPHVYGRTSLRVAGVRWHPAVEQVSLDPQPPPGRGLSPD